MPVSASALQAERSTRSHTLQVSSYIVSKSSSPVMVARRRLRTPVAHRSKSDLDRQPRVGSLDQAETEKESSAGLTNEDKDEVPEDEGRTDPPAPVPSSTDEIDNLSRENLFSQANDQISEVLRRHGRHRLSPRQSVSSSMASRPSTLADNMSPAQSTDSLVPTSAEGAEMVRSPTA